MSTPPGKSGTGRSQGGHVAEVHTRVRQRIVGRERELELLMAAIAAGRDILIEGPPGTSKTTLLRAVAAEWGIPLVFVEGNADLTPSKLIGHHDPARVLREGYTDDNFVDGPLLRAMHEGGFLYIEEFNRAPDDTLNTLLTAMAEREMHVPRMGRVIARDTFRVIGSMNPYDNIGTTRLSTSVHDRFNRISVTYQDEPAERQIVAGQAEVTEQGLGAELAETLRNDAVAVTRTTREHPDIRQGSSVRGAIDLALVAAQLLSMRDIAESGGTGRVTSEESPRRQYAETLYDAMVVTLSGRVHLDEAVPTTPEAVLRLIWEDYFQLSPAAAEPG